MRIKYIYRFSLGRVQDQYWIRHLIQKTPVTITLLKNTIELTKKSIAWKWRFRLVLLRLHRCVIVAAKFNIIGYIMSFEKSKLHFSAYFGHRFHPDTIIAPNVFTFVLKPHHFVPRQRITAARSNCLRPVFFQSEILLHGTVAVQKRFLKDQYLPSVHSCRV